eukprot:scaffold89599_cov55-Attheya_sp.AAC.2
MTDAKESAAALQEELSESSQEERDAPQYDVLQKVLAKDTMTPLLYEAGIRIGWNVKWDRWVSEDQLYAGTEASRTLAKRLKEEAKCLNRGSSPKKTMELEQELREKQGRGESIEMIIEEKGEEKKEDEWLVLTDDWEIITQCGLLHLLPVKVSVKDALNAYYEAKMKVLDVNDASSGEEEDKKDDDVNVQVDEEACEKTAE